MQKTNIANVHAWLQGHCTVLGYCSQLLEMASCECEWSKVSRFTLWYSVGSCLTQTNYKSPPSGVFWLVLSFCCYHSHQMSQRSQVSRGSLKIPWTGWCSKGTLSIDFNTVNKNCTVGMYFLILPATAVIVPCISGINYSTSTVPEFKRALTVVLHGNGDDIEWHDLQGPNFQYTSCSLGSVLGNPALGTVCLDTLPRGCISQSTPTLGSVRIH